MNNKTEKLIKECLSKSVSSMPRQSKDCPSEAWLLDYLNGNVNEANKTKVRSHIENCRWCIEQIDIAMRAKGIKKNNSVQVISFINRTKWLIVSVISFALSFFIHRFFIQFLTIAALSGIKYIVDTRTNKTLVMIRDAAKQGNVNRLRDIIEKTESKERF